MRVKQLESAATAGSGAPSGPGRIVLWRAGDGGELGRDVGGSGGGIRKGSRERK